MKKTMKTVALLCAILLGVNCVGAGYISPRAVDSAANLVENAGFESGTTGWTFAENGGFCVENGRGTEGGAALVLTTGAAATNAAAESEEIEIAESGVYHFSFYYRITPPAEVLGSFGKTAQVYLKKGTAKWFQTRSSQGTATESQQWRGMDADGEWHKYNASVSLAAGDKVKIGVLDCDKHGEGTKYCLDNFRLEKGVGILNGGFEDGNTSPIFMAGSDTLPAVSESEVYRGRYSLYAGDESPWANVIYSTYMPVVSEHKVRLSYYYKLPSGTVKYQVQTATDRWHGGSGVDIVGISSLPATGDAWRRVEHTFTVPSGKDSLVMRFRNPDYTEGFWLDDLEIVDLSALPSGISNGDFENGTYDGWYEKNAKRVFTVTKDGGTNGGKALKLSGCAGGESLNTSFAVEKNQKYLLSFYTKAQTAGNTVSVGAESGTLASETIGASADFVCNYVVFDSGENTAVNLSIEDAADGECLFDDFDIEKIGKGYIINGDFTSGGTSPWTVHDAEIASGRLVLCAGGSAESAEILLDENTEYILSFDYAADGEKPTASVKSGMNVLASHSDELWADGNIHKGALRFNSGTCNSAVISLSGAATGQSSFDNFKLSKKPIDTSKICILDFEGEGLSNWYVEAGADILEIAKTGAFSGKGFLKATAAKSGGYAFYTLSTEKNASYKLSFMQNIPEGVGGSKIAVCAGDVNLAEITPVGKGEWTSESLKFDSGAKDEVEIRIYDTANVGTVSSFDLLKIEKLAGLNVTAAFPKLEIGDYSVTASIENLGTRGETYFLALVLTDKESGMTAKIATASGSVAAGELPKSETLTVKISENAQKLVPTLICLDGEGSMKALHGALGAFGSGAVGEISGVSADLDGTVKIGGTTSDDFVSLKIVNKKNNAVEHMAQVVPFANGKYSHALKFTASSGNFVVWANGAKVGDGFKYINGGDITDLFLAINADQTGSELMRVLLTDKAELLDLAGFDMSPLTSAESSAQLAACTILAESETVYTESNLVQEVKKASILGKIHTLDLEIEASVSSFEALMNSAEIGLNLANDTLYGSFEKAARVEVLKYVIESKPKTIEKLKVAYAEGRILAKLNTSTKAQLRYFFENSEETQIVSMRNQTSFDGLNEQQLDNVWTAQEKESYTSLADFQTKLSQRITAEKGEGSNGGTLLGGGGSAGGGGGTPISIAVAPIESVKFSIAKICRENCKFSDLASVPWAENDICELFRKGVIDGVSEDMFEPNSAVTREAFVKMIVQAFGLKGEGDAYVNFSDVERGAWYYDYIEAAVNLGIVNGVGDASFGIGTPISRQDAAVIVGRVLEYSEISLAEKNDKRAFDDEKQIDSYARPAVESLQMSGILTGDENNDFAPKAQITRAEAGVLINRIISCAE